MGIYFLYNPDNFLYKRDCEDSRPLSPCLGQSGKLNYKIRESEMVVLETERLLLRRLNLDDAEVILEILNEPSWIQNIGDKNVHSIEDAKKYLVDSPISMYEQYGFGLYLVETRVGMEPIGLCGLIKRETLDDVDLGFAFLPRYWGRGYAFEAAFTTMEYGLTAKGLSRLVAITLDSNIPCIKLFKKLGFTFEKRIKLTEDTEELGLYSTEA